MRTLIVYESMFGNTRAVAEGIAEGMRDRSEVTVVSVRDATADVVGAADVLVVGGPTHVHGMTNRRSRTMAKTMAEKEGSGLTMEPNAVALGLRDWFKSLAPRPDTMAAAFDTRAHGKAIFTGRASKGIAHHLHRLGFRVSGTKSFFVDKDGRLDAAEIDRAKVWGSTLATVASVGQRRATAA